MLKKFFLNALSAFVGAWAAITLLIVAAIIFFVGLISSFASKEEMKLSNHSVLRIQLRGTIEEIDSEDNVDLVSLLQGNVERPQSLRTLIDALEEGAGNSKIDALYIECGGVAAAPATLDALRDAVLKFKKSGKQVFAYGDNLTMGDYYVASVADKLYLNPAGSLDIQGISGTVLYYKELLDKIGVNFEVVKVGTYKSAVEPYISNEMSEPARLQLDSLYREMWGYIRENIADSRGVQSATIDSLVNKFIFLEDAAAAARARLVDTCLYKREVRPIIARYVGEDVKKLNFISPDFLAPMRQTPGGKKQIAVLYATGEIGEYVGAGINCEKLVPIIVKLAEDDDVKGLVLRVNSPGGSVFGSEQIGEALDYFKKKGKKLAVSMGDYAASGGYWISAGADKIFADPLTITGSIGIFGLVPNVEGLMDKLGVHPQMVSTNPGVQFPSILRPMTPEQHEALQRNVERGYEKFINRVATGRKMSPEAVRKIAEGRVWNAMVAKKLGLVDDLGGLQSAIDWVADASDLKDYNLQIYPQTQPTFIDMMQMMLDQNDDTRMLSTAMKNRSFDKTMVQAAVWFLMQRQSQARALDLRLRL